MTIEERLDRIEQALGIAEATPVLVDPAPPAEPNADPAVADLEAGNRINAARRQAEVDAINKAEGR